MLHDDASNETQPFAGAVTIDSFIFIAAMLANLLHTMEFANSNARHRNAFIHYATMLNAYRPGQYHYENIILQHSG